MPIKSFPGKSYPLGTSYNGKGVNFSVFSKNAHKVQLCLFKHVDDEKPYKIFELDPYENKTFYYWHIYLEGIKPGQLYTFLVNGAYDQKNNKLFKSEKYLIDPYSYSIATGKYFSREAAKGFEGNAKESMKSVVVNLEGYDWEDDEPLHRPYGDTIIYEMHVGGFTRHDSSGLSEDLKGTYKGMIEKIPYLKELGITAVELLPVHQFDEQDAVSPLTNYWGYSPIGFFAPHNGYCSDKEDPTAPVREFRDMVKAFHKEGIEVILDVVYNHTAEGEIDGPTYCFKGFENGAYYLTSEDGEYLNYTGCGNTFNANHSIVRRLIMDSLKFWVKHMHVDGFRFDLASILSRDELGNPMDNPPILWEIESDPELAGTKIIAEAWDAAGLYQVGSFVGHKWAEWNGVFRDDIRDFLAGKDNAAWRTAKKIEGSHDVYLEKGRDPNRSINFVTCHDGFTLNDLVSYEHKLNYANGEHNRDGESYSHNWNCGVEGPTTKKDINELRIRQAKNHLFILMFSQGTPMINMGDEILRTQGGNNNAYCQDNKISWFDWSLLEGNGHMFNYLKKLIEINLSNPIFQEKEFWFDEKRKSAQHIHWHGVKLNKPDFGEWSKTLSFTLYRPGNGKPIHIIVNAYWEALKFNLPQSVSHREVKWSLVIDTFKKSPEDVQPGGVSIKTNKSVVAEPRSCLMLIGDMLE